MKTFKEYLKEKKVKKKSPDPAEANSLIKQAIDRFDDLLTLPLKEKNASFRFEDAYECLREIIHAFMALNGYKPYSHEAVIVYAFENELLTEKETKTLDRYREKRNDINYRGEKMSLDEAKQIISLTNEVISKLRRKFPKK